MEIGQPKLARVGNLPPAFLQKRLNNILLLFQLPKMDCSTVTRSLRTTFNQGKARPNRLFFASC
jgi:hypothetical protein